MTKFEQVKKNRFFFHLGLSVVRCAGLFFAYFLSSPAISLPLVFVPCCMVLLARQLATMFARRFRLRTG